MPVYTVHEPPLRAADDLAEPERFVFVRDGFSAWAFVLTPLWMIWHRLWLVLASYLVILLALDVAMTVIGAPSGVTTIVAILISLLVGLEAGTLRRFTLRRRGWRYAGFVSGDGREDAERRFFDTWARESNTPHTGSPPVAAMSAAPASRAPQGAPAVSSGVIGLFPEPGGRR
jgi:hypothetical protein